MAIYHLRASMISRSAGRSATGAAAYRSGEHIHDERTGLDFDYRARSCCSAWNKDPAFGVIGFQKGLCRAFGAGPFSSKAEKTRSE